MANINQVTLTAGVPTGPAGSSTVATISGLMQTVSIPLTPQVTAANTYGVRFVVGGVLNFLNTWVNPPGSGILQSVKVCINKIENNQWTFIPFNALPTAGTVNLVDALVANVAPADSNKALPPINLTYSNLLGTHTIAYATGIGMPIDTNSANLYAVLVTSGNLTNPFTSATDLQVEITVVQDN